MTTDHAMASRSDLLDVVRRLQAEFPDVAGDQVVRCVQIAREFEKSTFDRTASSAADASAYVTVVEAQARNYLAKFQAIRTSSPVPAPPTQTVIELAAVERRRIGRHRRDNKRSSAIA